MLVPTEQRSLSPTQFLDTAEDEVSCDAFRKDNQATCKAEYHKDATQAEAVQEVGGQRRNINARRVSFIPVVAQSYCTDTLLQKQKAHG